MDEPTKELSLAELPEAKLPMLPERFQPRNLTELMDWAKMVEASGLAPKGMNKAGIVLCVTHAAELRISPSQGIQNIAIINGRPSIWGDLGLALFRRDAAYKTFDERPPDECKQKGEGWCRIEMLDGRTIERRFSRADAQAAKLYERSGAQGPWNTYEGRMLMWRARWWAMRDADPGVFKGMSAAEEQEDIRDAVTGEKVGPIPLPRRKSEGVPVGEVDKFLKDVKPSSNASGPVQGGEEAVSKPPIDRSMLRKVMIHKTEQRQGAKKTFYVVSVEESSGKKYDANTFSSTDFETATKCKGDFALIATKEVTGKGGDGKDKVYTNLTHIEPAPKTQDEPPANEPGSAG